MVFGGEPLAISSPQIAANCISASGELNCLRQPYRNLAARLLRAGLNWLPFGKIWAELCIAGDSGLIPGMPSSGKEVKTTSDVPMSVSIEVDSAHERPLAAHGVSAR